MIKVIESYKTSVTLDDIINCNGSGSFMDDRSSIEIDNQEFVKLGKNKWQHIPNQEHALGGIHTDKEIYELARKTKNVKFYEE